MPINLLLINFFFINFYLSFHIPPYNCEKNKDFRNYRISDIENIWNLQKEIYIKNKEYIEAIKKNFDPFLSYGNFIKVKMTEEGKVLYERVTQNRPKLVKEERDIYI